MRRKENKFIFREICRRDDLLNVQQLYSHLIRIYRPTLSTRQEMIAWILYRLFFILPYHDLKRNHT